LDLYRPTRKVVLVIAACSSALICFLLIIFTSVLFFWCSLCKPKHYNIKQSDCFCVVALVVGKPAEHHIQRLVRSVLFFIISILFNTIRNILPATFGSNTGVDDFVGLQTLNLSWLTSVLGLNRKKRSQVPSYAYEFSCRRYLCALFTNSLTARHIIQSPTRIRTLPASYCV